MNVDTVEKVSCSYKELLVLVGPGYGRYQLLEGERERVVNGSFNFLINGCVWR